jgi:hypothetical protein
VVVDPLLVVAGLKVPHAPGALLPQLAVQSTPAFVESPVTVAPSVAALPSVSVVGKERVIVTLITWEPVTVATAAGLVAPLFAEIAVILTVPPVGTVDGAV